MNRDNTLHQIPIAEEFGWLRTEFSLAIAIQNLAWGIGQPIFGAIAEKVGDRKAIVLGALLYALGMVLSAFSTTPIEHQAYAWLVGFGVAGTGFGVILAVVGRASTDENRSMSLADSHCRRLCRADFWRSNGRMAFDLHDMAKRVSDIRGSGPRDTGHIAVHACAGLCLEKQSLKKAWARF